jgi:hypothetical protein
VSGGIDMSDMGIPGRQLPQARRLMRQLVS